MDGRALLVGKCAPATLVVRPCGTVVVVREVKVDPQWEAPQIRVAGESIALLEIVAVGSVRALIYSGGVLPRGDIVEGSPTAVVGLSLNASDERVEVRFDCVRAAVDAVPVG